MNNFSNFINTPEHSLFPPTDKNIIEEYRRRQDIGSVAKVFDIARSDVRSVLKKAGIILKKQGDTMY